MGTDYKPSVIDAVNETLMSLATFLGYTELPESAEQLRNMHYILQTLIDREEQAKHAANAERDHRNQWLNGGRTEDWKFKNTTG